MLEYSKTNLNNVLLFKPEIFEDFRGEFVELYNEKEYKNIIFNVYNKNVNFVEDDISITLKHNMKGIHVDNEAWKLISCLYGKFYLIVINYDTNSKEYGKWQGFTLSDKNRHQILVPPKFGNGHLALTELSIYHYKQTEYYNISRQSTIIWNDSRFNIWYPVKSPIISQRDECVV